MIVRITTAPDLDERISDAQEIADTLYVLINTYLTDGLPKSYPWSVRACARKMLADKLAGRRDSFQLPPMEEE